MSFDVSSFQHYPAVDEIVDVLCNKTKNKDRGFFQAEVAYFMGKIASSMRATIVTKHQGEIPVNVYAIALAPSGYGKGHSIYAMEEEFLKAFKHRFMEDTFPVLADQNLWVIANDRAARNGTDQQEEYDKAKKEFEDLGEFDLEFDSATAPAVKGQLRKKLLFSNVGSMNLQMDEIGLNLTGNAEVLAVLLELYDQGMIKQKLIKNSNDNKRGSRLDGKTPANMLMFGTPSMLFDGGQTEDQFYAFLETGYARRCIFGSGQHNDAFSEMSAQEIYDQLVQPAHSAAITKWSRHFYTLADPAYHNWKMAMPDNVGIVLIEYQQDCDRRAKEFPEHEEIRKAEMSHRHTKALKLAGAYAFIDGSTEVLMDHLTAAIKLVEESGKAFQTILNREKSYEKLAKFIANSPHEVTHADIHEKLPQIYPKSAGPRNDMMMLATSWGYKKHIIIKKSFVDGIEFFKGETLEETDLDKLVCSYSDHYAYNYANEQAPFTKLHLMTQHEGLHWCNHHFKNGHRLEENALAGFNMLVLDVDEGTRLETAMELMADYKFFVYTTKRHQTEGHGDRFRMILPTNYKLELSNDEYKDFMQNVFSWLPFATDESYEKREKKSESFAGGQYLYNLEGDLLDVLPFIPKTSRNEQYRKDNQGLGSLDNLERWFASRIQSGNRNNQMIKYALCLVDAGWDYNTVRDQVLAFDKKLQNPMGEDEISRSILVTVAKRIQEKTAA
jgi:hypothetical protein